MQHHIPNILVLIALILAVVFLIKGPIALLAIAVILICAAYAVPR